ALFNQRAISEIRRTNTRPKRTYRPEEAMSSGCDDVIFCDEDCGWNGTRDQQNQHNCLEHLKMTNTEHWQIIEQVAKQMSKMDTRDNVTLEDLHSLAKSIVPKVRRCYMKNGVENAVL